MSPDPRLYITPVQLYGLDSNYVCIKIGIAYGKFSRRELTTAVVRRLGVAAYVPAAPDCAFRSDASIASVPHSDAAVSLFLPRCSPPWQCVLSVASPDTLSLGEICSSLTAPERFLLKSLAPYNINSSLRSVHGVLKGDTEVFILPKVILQEIVTSVFPGFQDFFAENTHTQRVPWAKTSLDPELLQLETSKSFIDRLAQAWWPPPLERACVQTLVQLSADLQAARAIIGNDKMLRSTPIGAFMDFRDFLKADKPPLPPLPPPPPPQPNVGAPHDAASRVPSARASEGSAQRAPTLAACRPPRASADMLLPSAATGRPPRASVGHSFSPRASEGAVLTPRFCGVLPAALQRQPRTSNNGKLSMPRVSGGVTPSPAASGPGIRTLFMAARKLTTLALR